MNDLSVDHVTKDSMEDLVIGDHLFVKFLAFNVDLVDQHFAYCSGALDVVDFIIWNWELQSILVN